MKMKPKPAGFEFDEVDVSKILRPNSHRKYIQVGSTIPHLLCSLIFLLSLFVRNQEPAFDSVVFIARPKGIVPLSTLCPGSVPIAIQ